LRQIDGPRSLSIDRDLKRIEYGITTNLSYGHDWTFDILASQNYVKGLGGLMDDIDNATSYPLHSHLNNDFSSYSSKLIVGAWRHYDNFAIGAEWAHGNNLGDFELFSSAIGDAWKQDILSLRGKYSYPLMDGHLLGWADLKYGMVNDTVMNLFVPIPSEVSNSYKYYEIEGMPLAYKYGPITIGYYMKHREFDNFLDAKMTEQQLKLCADIYSNERLSIYGEYTFGLRMKADIDVIDTYLDGKVLDAGDRQKFAIGAKYAINESLMLNGDISYQELEYETDGPLAQAQNVDNKFKETKLCVGLTYMF
ncbi:MAG: hypothetical protein Q7K48_07470, partial [Fusobacterium sp. JB021]|nr:hypothetical protein [Fusobacterium sp. JB021]